MKTKAKSDNKRSKPFLAARIPHGLESALEAHIKETGESKTELIINAIGAYIKWSADKEQPIASDRLRALEEKVEELEKLIRTPQQQNLLDIKPVIKSVKQSDNRNNSNSERKEQLLTHRQVSEITGINYNSIKSRPRSKNKTVEGNGREFEVTQSGKGWKWKEVTQHQED